MHICKKSCTFARKIKLLLVTIMKMYSEYRAQARETLKGRWNEMALLMLLIGLITAAFEAPSVIGAAADLFCAAMNGNHNPIL